MFTFYCEQLNKYYNVVLSDISTYPNYYNEFILDEPTDVDFDISGYYQYTVREQVSPTNTDPSLSGKVLEVGRMRVYEATEKPEQIFYEGGVSSNEVYNYSESS